MVFALCIACATWAVEPKDALIVTSVMATNRIGGIQRVRYVIQNTETQYPVGNISARLDWMRQGATGAPYAVKSDVIQVRQIKPYGMEVGECSVSAPPPCRAGETEAGFTITPVSAFYILGPRSL